jgi:hypothetical protein
VKPRALILLPLSDPRPLEAQDAPIHLWVSWTYESHTSLDTRYTTEPTVLMARGLSKQQKAVVDLSYDGYVRARAADDAPTFVYNLLCDLKQSADHKELFSSSNDNLLNGDEDDDNGAEQDDASNVAKACQNGWWKDSRYTKIYNYLYNKVSSCTAFPSHLCRHLSSWPGALGSLGSKHFYEVNSAGQENWKQAILTQRLPSPLQG